MKLGQTSAVYFISKIGVSAIGFFATVYLTRTVGEETYGFYAITLALVSWLGIVKRVGFGKAMVKRMSESEESDAYLIAGTTIKVFLTGIVAVGILALDDQVNAYVGQAVAEFVVLLLIVTVFSDIVNNGLKGTHRVHLYAPLTMFREAARSLLMVLFVIMSWELTGMLIGHATGTILMAFIGLLVVKPTLIMPRRKHFTHLFNYAKYSWLGSMRSKTFSSADIIILGAFVPAGLTGIYAVAYSLSEFLDLFGEGVKTTLFPEMSKLATENNNEMIGKLTTDALAFAGLFLVPGVVGATILGDRLMLIYGPDFEIGDRVLVILLLGLVLYTYAKQLLNTLNAIDRPDLAFRANGIFIGSNLALNILLVWQIGWVGAAIATAVSAAIGLVFSHHYASAHVPFSLPLADIAHQWVAAVGMGVAVYAVRMVGETHWISEYNAAFVVALVSFGALVYFLVLLSISSTFRTTVSRNLPFDVPVAR